MKYIIKMSNGYGNFAIHSEVDSEEIAKEKVQQLKESQSRYDNHYWYEPKEKGGAE